MTNGTLLDSRPIEIPISSLAMARRTLRNDDFSRYAAVQMHEITYWSEGLRIKAFLCLPPAEQYELLPGLIFNAGGTGERGALSPLTAAATVALYASWGYVVLASQYRGRGGSEGTEEWGAGDVDDAMNALLVMMSLPYVDTERLGIIGGSRGGMMALQMLTRTSIFKAAVVFGAPTDFTTLTEDSYILTTARRFIPSSANLGEELAKRSAALYADKLCKTTPLLVQHGSGDRRVDVTHAYKLGMALQKTLHPYKLIIYDNADHVLAGRREESNADTRYWLDMYVKHRAPLPRVGPHGA
ncbi:MAG: prolyl oligopeptidase family serine peptidase [Bacteroidota bacterium]|nr:prolyl oligopeptidase family serine peptidase [Candidatus Kapabacteria bacterium]MDW8219502.1 prolyl oligopeptidase family serine peptidase [Bacteroidota bacterium]